MKLGEADNTRNRITFFRSYYEAAQILDADIRLQFYEALLQFAFDGVIPDFDAPILQVAWTLARPNVEKSIANSENGQKGGRPNKKNKKEASKKDETPLSVAENPASAAPKSDKERDEERDGNGGDFYARRLESAHRNPPPPEQRCFNCKCGGTMLRTGAKMPGDSEYLYRCDSCGSEATLGELQLSRCAQ